VTAQRRRLQSSRYNFFVPIAGDGILYNAASGASMRLAGDDTSTLAHILCGAPQKIKASLFPRSILNSLRRGGFLVENDADELTAIRARYWRARGQTPMVLTVTTTQDCNLGCYYCYESRSDDRLEQSDLPALLNWTRQRLSETGKRSLHVDWYGGEPLLNVEFLETASQQFQDLALDLGVAYSASIISNGTCWPHDAAAFIGRHKIRQVQISFDGLKSHHDKRRRYRKQYSPDRTTSSFEQAAALVDDLLEVVRVDIRFNADSGNFEDLEGFLALCISSGWFDRPHPCVFQLARISDFSTRANFLGRTKLTEDQFERLRETARRLVPDEVMLDETTTRSIYPMPRTSVCAALANDSIVIGADGNHYRCGLQVGERDRSVLLRRANEDAVAGSDAKWWNEFDPTLQPNCSQCSFLPVCWGGCPKKHLEQDTRSLDEQSLYWRKALPQKIAWRFGVVLKECDFSFTESDQFRLPTGQASE